MVINLPFNLFKKKKKKKLKAHRSVFGKLSTFNENQNENLFKNKFFGCVSVEKLFSLSRKISSISL